MSSRDNQSKSLFGGVVLFLLLGAFAYMAGRPTGQGGANTDTEIEGIVAPTAHNDPIDQSTEDLNSTNNDSLELITFKNSPEASQILVGERIIFTDADESWKIQEQLGFVNGLVIVKTTSQINTEVFDIRSISIDGAGSSELLFEGIDSNSTPVLSPNLEQIALTSFDNAERSFGFRLFVLDRNGIASDVDNNDSLIAHALWRSNEELFYVVGESDQTIKLVTLGLGAIDFASVPIGEHVTALAWDGQLLYYATRNDSDNRSRLYSLDFGQVESELVIDDSEIITQIEILDKRIFLASDNSFREFKEGTMTVIEVGGELIGVRS